MQIKEILQQLTQITKANDTPEAFVSLCTTVKALREYFDKEITYYCTDTEQHYKFDELMHEYGLEKSQASRLLNSHARYFDQDEIKKIFTGFTKCKLFELLVVPTSILEPDIKSGRISSYSTVREIRKYARLNKPKRDAANSSDITDAEQDEENIPDKYDPSKIYPFSYAEDKNKAQLQNMWWELQKYAHEKRGVK